MITYFPCIASNLKAYWQPCRLTSENHIMRDKVWFVDSEDWFALAEQAWVIRKGKQRYMYLHQVKHDAGITTSTTQRTFLFFHLVGISCPLCLFQILCNIAMFSFFPLLPTISVELSSSFYFCPHPSPTPNFPTPTPPPHRMWYISIIITYFRLNSFTVYCRNAMQWNNVLCLLTLLMFLLCDCRPCSVKHMQASLIWIEVYLQW